MSGGPQPRYSLPERDGSKSPPLFKAPEHLHEPYPGLRPFLDHEHELLRGRAEPIREVVERLGRTHFVAVIGGSGSGKSSLIRAGVVPMLRTGAIEHAGDYWIPVVFTPGAANATGRGQADKKGAETPLTRLAWKFACVLRQMDEPGQSYSMSLTEEITTFLRQGSGFAGLTDAYHSLLPLARPRSNRARFLFVIDQFEEIFHPGLRTHEDTLFLVQALIDHFRDPGERSFVIMTMRSEHLADCAGYLNLPDAINRSFYLVRRHRVEELRQVIIEPAQIFLRERQRMSIEKTATRSDASRAEFNPEVVTRLLRDAAAIEGDPDHLPLLQHMLARLWSTALAREGLPSRDAVPSQITMSDLAVASDPANVNLSDEDVDHWLSANKAANSLRLSLERWTQHSYQTRNEAERKQLDTLFEHLAVRDPTNGTHLQQRVHVDDPALLSALALSSEGINRLIHDGFLDGVKYLFWDGENADHITLKVSHEAFIRGWPHFRYLIDAKAERFEEFVNLMRRCLEWKIAGYPKQGLLSSNDLRRLSAAGLGNLLVQTDDRQKLIDTMRHSDMWERPLSAETDLVPFLKISESEENLRNRKAHEKKVTQVARARNKRQVTMAAVAALPLLCIAIAYYYFLDVPYGNAIISHAKALEKTVLRQQSEGSVNIELHTLSEAAGDLIVARRALPGPPFSDPRFALNKGTARLAVSNSGELIVSQYIRSLLTTAPWKSASPSTAASLPSASTSSAECAGWSGEPGVRVRVNSGPDGLYIVKSASALIVYNARFNGSACALGSEAFSVPAQLDAALFLDSSASVIGIVSQSNAAGQAVTLHDVVWTDQEGPMTARLATRRVLTSDEGRVARDAVRSSSKQYVFEHPTRRVPGGVEIDIGGEHWKLLSSRAQPLSEDLAPDDSWSKPLQRSQPDSACNRYARKAHSPSYEGPSLSNQNDRLPIALSHSEKHRELCIVVRAASLTPGANDAQTIQSGSKRTQVFIELFPEATLLADEGTKATERGLRIIPAATTMFTEHQGTVDNWTWRLGAKEPWVGWLAAEATADAPLPSDVPAGSRLATPFSLESLKSLADEILKDTASPNVTARDTPPGISSAPESLDEPGEQPS